MAVGVPRTTESLCPDCNREAVERVLKGEMDLADFRDNPGVVEAEILEEGGRILMLRQNTPGIRYSKPAILLDFAYSLKVALQFICSALASIQRCARVRGITAHRPGTRPQTGVILNSADDGGKPMKKFARIMLIAVGFGLVTVALGFLTSNPRPAQAAPIAAPVIVTNTPLPIQGSVTASISNASVPVSGTVAVSSLPPVTLSGTSPVSFSNTPTTPIYADADRPARNGFGAQCFSPPVDSSGQTGCTIATIPAGREVVIETITCHIAVGTGRPPQMQLNAPSLQLGGGGGPFYVSYYLQPTRIYGDSSSEVWRFASPLRIYAFAAPAGSVDIGVNLQSGTSTVPQGFNCAIGGYMVGQ